ncbi:CinA family protein [Sphingomonas sp.]|uniref:CinA family protein n=1 Tax=Sphingomonas sp. TaxID=28214 RepID=UPI0025F0594C|nr:CinA family protein [Sphingomonas sp.]
MTDAGSLPAAPTSARIDTLLPAELVAVARTVLDANRAIGRTVAVAESCTGGLVAAALTEHPGASDVFIASIVSYSNAAKIAHLGVGSDIVETFGAVSIATAWAMAQGMLNRSDADIAVAITGIAGPDGGDAKKPVGTVVFAVARRGGDPENVHADKRFFVDNGRGGVRLQAALCALELMMPVDP